MEGVQSKTVDTDLESCGDRLVGPGLGRGSLPNGALYRETRPRGPAGWPGSNTCSGAFAASFCCLTPSPTRANLRASVCVFQGITESIGSIEVFGNPKPERKSQPPADAREHAGRNMLTLIDRRVPAGYSLNGLVATRARLCVTGEIRLTCTLQTARQKRTFLLCQEEDISTLP